MLCSLRVTNLAVVEQAAVEFAGGLNVVTGETGAGKSILMGALDLVLGARADRSLIRTGAEKCSVEAVFELDDTAAVDAVLDEAGMSACEERRLLVRRELTASGAGKTVVNGETAAVQTLRAIGNLLVDMHGPHDHQSLLSRTAQLDILDAYGKTGKERTAYRDVWNRRCEIEEQIEALQDEIYKLERKLNLNIDEVQEVLGLVRNVYKTYVKAPDELKRLYLGLFWDKFEAAEKKIVKAEPAKFIKALMDARLVILNQTQKPRINEASALNPQRGDHQPLLADESPDQMASNQPVVRLDTVWGG